MVRLCEFLANFFALGLRLVLWHDFVLKSAWLKIKDMDSTLYLFSNDFYVTWLPLPPTIVEKYHLAIPQVPPVLAAYSGTYIELIVPTLLLLGIGGRIPALLLFCFNYVALVSYPSLWTPDWEVAFKDHIIWGVMSACLLFYGVGKISIDRVLQKKFFPTYRY